VFLTEVRLTETPESERRQHSGFWRESVIGRVLAWIPGLAREPEGDVKKARPPELTRVLRSREEGACGPTSESEGVWLGGGVVQKVLVPGETCSSCTLCYLT